MKLEFPIGSIVSINGKDMDSGRWPTRKDAPRFHGVVKDPSNFDTPDAFDMNAHKLYVSFVVSGEYEWYNWNSSNVLQSNYDHKFLNLLSNPPTDTVYTKLYDEYNHMRWFIKNESA